MGCSFSLVGSGTSTANCRDSCLVQSGLHGCQKQHGASSAGGNHNAWGLQGWRQLQHGGMVWVARALGSRTAAILCWMLGRRRRRALNHPCDEVQAPTWRHGNRHQGCLPHGSTERVVCMSPGKALQHHAKSLGIVTRIRVKNQLVGQNLGCTSP